MSCVLCGTERGTVRTCGFDVCDRCLTGDVDDGLARWGMAVATERTSTTVYMGRPNRDQTVHNLDVALTHPTPLPVEVKFRAETTIDRLRDWFTGTEPQAGDPAFDRMVYVDPATDDEAFRALLADEGVQSSVMELVTVGRGVELEPGKVICRLSSVLGPPEAEPLILPMLLLAVHLETRAQLEGAPPPAGE